MARIPDIATVIAPDASSITFTPNIAGAKPLTIRRTDIPQGVADYGVMHGLKQRLVDAAALGQFHTTGPKKGQKATIEDKWQEVLDLWAYMSTEGKWHRVNIGGDGADTGLLVAAVMRATGAPLADVEALVQSWDRATQAAMRDTDPTISPIVAEIRRERASANAPAVSAAATALAGLMARRKGE